MDYALVSVPLTSIDVKLTVNGFIGNVDSVLHFKNTESKPIEAVYEFPLDDQSAVYHFEARIEDRVIVAECQPKKQAKETYDDAIAAGQTATLMEEDDSASDMFRCLLGNLPAGVEAVVKFSYVIELPITAEGSLRFILPTQLNPRYNPSLEKGGTDKPVDVTYVMPGGDQPYKFTFGARIFNTGKVSRVKSGSDKDELSVSFSDENRQAEVSLVNSFCADHDLSLEIVNEDVVSPHVIIEKGDSHKDGILGKDVVMLNFYPQLSESAFSHKHEFIFVIDRSGSMAGSRIASASKALLVFLKSLPPGCYFNIVGFGSTFSFLFQEGSREYTEETLHLATKYQSDLHANLGGTEILEPLKAIYRKPPLSTYSRQILVLTDGDVSNTQTVIDTVGQNVSNSRVFAIGIGEGASTSLVKGIARAGRGKAEFVLKNDEITGLVMKTLKAAMQATVTDLELVWELGGSAKLVQVPRELPPLFGGDRLIVYAINSGKQTVLDGRVRLKGKVGENVIDFSLNVSSSTDTSQFDESLPIHRLAAKAEIKRLQDAGKDKKNKSEITSLSMAVNMVSKYTSMVGVDLKSKKRVTESMVQRKVPLMMFSLSATLGSPKKKSLSLKKSHVASSLFSSPTCSSKCDRVRSFGVSLPRNSLRPAFSAMAEDVCCASVEKSAAYEDFDCDNMVLCDLSVLQHARASSTYSAASDKAFQTTFSAVKHYSTSPTKPAVAADYMSVVSLQAFNGSFKLDEKLANLTLGFTQQQLIDAAPVKSLDVWATVIALALLTSKFADQKGEWEMIAMKARQWLSSQPLEGHSVDDLIQQATNLQLLKKNVGEQVQK